MQIIKASGAEFDLRAARRLAWRARVAHLNVNPSGG